jgi:hypothetical protein
MAKISLIPKFLNPIIPELNPCPNQAVTTKGW